MGRLERKLDLELIARVRAGIKLQPEPLRTTKRCRVVSSYRAARRNLAKDMRIPWHGIGVKAHALPRGLYKVNDQGVVVPKAKTYRPNGKRECARRLHG